MQVWNGNSQLYRIPVKYHPRFITTNCGVETVTLYRGLSVYAFFSLTSRAKWVVASWCGTLTTSVWYPYYFCVVSFLLLCGTLSTSVWYPYYFCVAPLPFLCYPYYFCVTLSTSVLYPHYFRVVPLWLLCVTLTISVWYPCDLCGTLATSVWYPYDFCVVPLLLLCGTLTTVWWPYYYCFLWQSYLLSKHRDMRQVSAVSTISHYIFSVGIYISLTSPWFHFGEGGKVPFRYRFHWPSYQSKRGPRQRSRYSDSLRAGRCREPIPVRARFSAPVQIGPGAHSASYTMRTGSLSRGKAAGAWRNHPPLSSAEVKERVELYFYSPSGPSWLVLGRTLHFS